MKHWFRIVILCLFGVACQTEAPPQYATPEATLRAYQAFIDNNNFEAAKALSTPAEQRRLETMSRIIVEEALDSSVLTTQFLKLRCEEQGDTAFCLCEVEDQYERYEENYRLIRIEEKWHIDAPDEEIIIENEVPEDR
ncbi:MAG: hypothetical protein AAF798_14830 [Bacteroidota bacterium]